MFLPQLFHLTFPPGVFVLVVLWPLLTPTSFSTLRYLSATLAGQKLSCLAIQPYSRRLICSSGLGFRIIAAPCELSPQCAYRVGRTKKAPAEAGACV